VLAGEEAPDALLSNVERAVALFGEPETPVERMIEWTAAWVCGGGELLGKPTHFDTRDGNF
jgi:hypothetical protein